MPRSGVGKKSAGVYFDSPVAGAYMPITVFSDWLATTSTDTIVVNLDDVLPPGMKVRLIGSSLSASVLSAGTVAVDVGTSADPDAYIDNQAAAAAGSEYSKCNGTGAADATVGDFEFDPSAAGAAGTLRVTVTLTGATYEGLTVILWVLPTAHDSDIAGR